MMNTPAPAALAQTVTTIRERTLARHGVHLHLSAAFAHALLDQDAGDGSTEHLLRLLQTHGQVLADTVPNNHTAIDPHALTGSHRVQAQHFVLGDVILHTDREVMAARVLAGIPLLGLVSILTLTEDGTVLMQPVIIHGATPRENGWAFTAQTEDDETIVIDADHAFLEVWELTETV